MAPIRSFKLLRPDQTIAAVRKRLENSAPEPLARPKSPDFPGNTLRRKKEGPPKRAFKGALTQDATYKRRNQAVLV
jgi:hypothetical protein